MPAGKIAGKSGDAILIVNSKKRFLTKGKRIEIYSICFAAEPHFHLILQTEQPQ